jgi:hypothetical protein
MVKATIKSQKGPIITVEGTEREVSNILTHFKPLARDPQLRRTVASRKALTRDERKRRTASDIILGLKREGYFNKPKTLADIAGALEEKGYIYPTTTLSGVMLLLVKRKDFGRKKRAGKWVYGK